MRRAPRRCAFLKDHFDQVYVPAMECVEERSFLVIANLIGIDSLLEYTLGYLDLIVDAGIGKRRPSE